MSTTKNLLFKNTRTNSYTHTHTEDGHSNTAYSTKRMETTSKSFIRLMVKYIHTMKYYTTFKTVKGLLALT